MSATICSLILIPFNTDLNMMVCATYVVTMWIAQWLRVSHASASDAYMTDCRLQKMR
jgi:hypothetical protein